MDGQKRGGGELKTSQKVLQKEKLEKGPKRKDSKPKACFVFATKIQNAAVRCVGVVERRSPVFGGGSFVMELTAAAAAVLPRRQRKLTATSVLLSP